MRTGRLPPKPPYRSSKNGSRDKVETDPMAKPIRVLMVVRLFYPWVGGMERQAHKLAKSLTKRGVSVEISTGWWFRGTPQHEQLDGIPITRNTTLWDFFGIKGLRK